MSERKIYFAAAEFAYNDERRGPSYEKSVLFKCAKDVFPNAELVDVYNAGSHRPLLDKIRQESRKDRPLVVYVPFRALLGPVELREIRKHADIGILNLDDTWRTDLVSLYLNYCDWFTTSDPNHRWRYQGRHGLKSRFLPFGYDAEAAARFSRPFADRDIQLSFVGARDRYREYIVKKLASQGIEVSCYGAGWPAGSLSQEKFYDVIGRSRYALNLSNSTSWDARFLLRYPMALARNLKSNKTVEQLKARHSEIAALGACQFSFYTSGIEHLFDIGRDIYVYPNVDELAYMVARISDDEAAMAASRASERVAELSYQKQFSELFALQRTT